MNKSFENTMNAAIFFVVFIIVQFAVSLSAKIIFGESVLTADLLVATSITNSVVLIALFAWRKWSPMSRRYLDTRPWDIFFWVFACAMGMITLSSFIIEIMGLRMDEHHVRLFTKIMDHRYGYIAIGIVAPVAEEMVFRGAIQRSLHNVLGNHMRWMAIFITALLFGIVHGNMTQAVNATISGMLLGWMYCRTGSILPGVLFHWMNNTIAYALFKLMPGTADMTLSEMCGGDGRIVAVYVLCSLCVVIPSIYQLSLRMKRN